MNCTRQNCGGRLVPMNLLDDQPRTHRHFSKAKLIGFSDPNGFRCDNANICTNTYALDTSSNLRLLDCKVRHDHRDDLGTEGGIWEIVDVWEMVSGKRWDEEDGEEDFPLPTADDIEDEIIRNDAKRWHDNDVMIERYEPDDEEDYSEYLRQERLERKQEHAEDIRNKRLYEESLGFGWYMRDYLDYRHYHIKYRDS